MLKRLCSLALVICMVFTMCSFVFAEFSYIDGFTENNMSAKQIVVAKNHAFVVCGEDNEAKDVINIYNLENKKLVASLSKPVYETGRDYFVENIYAAGEYMYISWNRNRGWGDPSVHKYEIDAMIGGKLESVKSYGIRGEHVSCIYEDKIFYTEPKIKTLDILTTNDDISKDVMSLTEFDTKDLETKLKAVLADDDYFYIVWTNEIRAYKTENVYNGLMQNYNDTAAQYTSEKDISGIELNDGKLYLTDNQGINVLKIDDGNFKTVGRYDGAKEITSMTFAGGNLYIYAKDTKSIKILDVKEIENITQKEEISVKNPDTEGIADIYIDGNRIYVADLTEGFTMYSANEFDKIKAEEAHKAESFSEELGLSQNAKAIKLVVGLNIMELKSDGLFGTGGYITRGEFASAASKLLGNMANGTNAIKEFSDVTLNSENAFGIYALANLGILNGYGDGTFRPDEVVSYEHATQILLKIMGYYPLVSSPNRTCMDIAAELGILKNVKAAKNGYITRENVAQLIYNALETETLEFASGINPIKYESYKGETLLYKIGIKKAAGRVTATEFTSLIGKTNAKDGSVLIDGVNYSEGLSGASDYLGRSIKFYYRYEDEYENEILYAEPKEDDVLTIPSDKISDETTELEFVYFDENDKLVKEDIKNASVIFNGTFLSNYKATDLAPKEGEVSLIDYDGDGEFETIIVTNYHTCIVEAYADNIFKFKYDGGEINLNKYANNAEYISVSVDGVAFDPMGKIDGVKEWSVVSFLESRDKKILKIYVTNNVTAGMVTGITGDKVKIEDQEYQFNSLYLTNKKILRANVGEEIFAYMDKFGKIAAVSNNELSSMYGYLLKFEKFGGGLSQSAKIKVLQRDQNNTFGTVTILETSENLKINDKKFEDIYEAKELFDENGTIDQFIMYHLNLKGEVSKIYTAKNHVDEFIDGVKNPDYMKDYQGYDEDNFSYDCYIPKSVAYRGGSIQGFEGYPYAMGPDTDFYIIPEYDDAGDSEYKIYHHVNLFTKSGMYAPGDLYLYDVDNDKNMQMVVIKITSEVNVDVVAESTNFAVIDSVMIGLDERNEEKYIINTGFDADNKQTQLYVADEEIKDETGACNIKYKDTKLIDLPKGSVIQYLKNSRNEITAIRIVFIPTEEKEYFEYGSPRVPTATYLPITFYSGFAKVIKVTKNGRILFNSGGVTDGDNMSTINRSWDRNLELTKNIYLYDKSMKNIKIMDKDNILPGDDILLIKRGASTSIIVVYR